MMHVRKGDTVEVIAGREKGKRGRVLRVDGGKGRVLIEKVNLIKRHMRPTQRHPQGGILEKEAGLALSNVLAVCSSCDAPRRVGAKIEDGVKRRVCVKCGGRIEAAS